MNKRQVLEKQKDSIMDWFDFSRVAKIMEQLHWTWHEINGVPEEPEIRQEARKLLNYTIENEEGVSTGGFKTSYIEGKDSYGEPWVRLGLEFILESWAEDGEEYEE